MKSVNTNYVERECWVILPISAFWDLGNCRHVVRRSEMLDKCRLD